jgi:hypothetical protein
MSKIQPLPLSFGPDAVCLRTRGGVHSVAWADLGRIASGADRVEACTLHVRKDGTYSVTVGSDRGHSVRDYAPDALRYLFVTYGVRIERD